MEITAERPQKGLPGLRRVRLDALMSQSALAEKAGLTQVTVSNLEKGKRVPAELTIAKLAHALGVEPEALSTE